MRRRHLIRPRWCREGRRARRRRARGLGSRHALHSESYVPLVVKSALSQDCWGDPPRDGAARGGVHRILPTGARAGGGTPRYPGVGLGNSSLQVVGTGKRSPLARCPRGYFAAVQGGPQAVVRPRGSAAQRHREGRRDTRAPAREHGPTPPTRQPDPLRARGPVLAGGNIQLDTPSPLAPGLPRHSGHATGLASQVHSGKMGLQRTPHLERAENPIRAGHSSRHRAVAARHDERPCCFD